jgi:hypothetical protein
MKYKTLVRIAVKLIGVFFIVEGLVTLSFHAVFLFESIFQVFGVGFDQQRGYLMVANTLPRFTQITVGLYLFFGGRRVVDAIIPSNRPYCPECGYDLTSNPTDQCPECGTRIPADLSRRVNGA